MNIIILGSNGMLGSMLYFIIKTRHPRLNAIQISKTDFDALHDSVEKFDTLIPVNSIIVNCIGAIPQKKYSNEHYTLLNTTFPQELAIYCKNRDLKLIHISTNCVFSGIKDNCLESDVADADDTYGQSKFLGEPSYGLTIRCSIIGPEKHTFCGLLEWFLHNTSLQVNGFTDSFWNGLTTLELTKIILEYIDLNNVADAMVHHYSENSLSKYDILEYINNIFAKHIVINRRENGLKYYTLSSNYTKPRKSIQGQINELYSVFNEYKQFYNLK
jgi:dTDP-4-dehydrorhamnose reductase